MVNLRPGKDPQGVKKHGKSAQQFCTLPEYEVDQRLKGVAVLEDVKRLLHRCNVQHEIAFTIRRDDMLDIEGYMLEGPLPTGIPQTWNHTPPGRTETSLEYDPTVL